MFGSRFWLQTRTSVRRRLTWRARAVIFSGVVLISLALISQLHPFLAQNDPLPDCETLLVEGWIPDYAVVAAAERFQRGGVTRLITTGLPIERGGLLSSWGDYAHVAAATLEKAGVPRDRIFIVPSPAQSRDRTEASARSASEFLVVRLQDGPRRLNVLTLGPHARRTRLCYRRAFGNQWQIGITNVPSQEYDPARWWQSSAGVKSVLGETIALVYTWFR